MKIDQLIELDPNERILMVVKRHWSGLIPTIFSATVIFIAGLAGVFALSRFRDSVEQIVSLPIAILGLLVLVAFLLFVMGISVWVYTHNMMVVTNEKVVQLLYFSLFNRQISRLILQDIQDVTYRQTGILSRFFKYGTLHMETAGEAANFDFPYAVNPHEVSQRIGAMCEELRRLPVQDAQQSTTQQQPQNSPANNAQPNQNQNQTQ